jgi:hypothetical protein
MPRKRAGNAVGRTRPAGKVMRLREVTTREKRMPGMLNVVGVLHVSVQGSRAARGGNAGRGQ